MTKICPTVLADNPHSFREQIERVASFAERVQIDLTDGIFASKQTIELKQIWWPHSVAADLHLMYERPDLFIKEAIKLNPSLVIIHAEAQGNFYDISSKLRSAGIKTGVALLEETHADKIADALDTIDHVLIFSGDLGHFGGRANLELLNKVKYLKEKKASLEVGWDGGINAENAQELIAGGVDVLNVGGFIQRSKDPTRAYAILKEIAENKK